MTKKIAARQKDQEEIKMTRQIMRWIAKCLLASAAVVAAVSALILLANFISDGGLNFTAAISANFVAAFIAAILGVFSLISSETAADQPSSRFHRLAAATTSLGQNSSANLDVPKPPQANPKNLRLDVLQRARPLFIGLGIFAITLSAQFLLGVI